MSDNHADTYTDACTVCHGRGVVDVEDADGATRGHQTCPYCGGAQTSMWAANRLHSEAERQQAKITRRWRRALLFLLFTAATLPIPAWDHFSPDAAVSDVQPFWSDLHGFVLCVALYYLWIAWKYRPMTANRLARRRFTTQEEYNLVRAASWGLIGGLWLKDSLYRQHQRNARAAQQQQSNIR